jgi:hypothetical protein
MCVDLLTAPHPHCRREQQAAAANAALQSQLSQQQHMLEAQQQQLASMQEQLLQLKDLHKKKLTRYKAQLQQQYETQLAAATTAYTQELSLVHVRSLATGRTVFALYNLQFCHVTPCTGSDMMPICESVDSAAKHLPAKGCRHKLPVEALLIGPAFHHLALTGIMFSKARQELTLTSSN